MLNMKYNLFKVLLKKNYKTFPETHTHSSEENLNIPY